MAGWADSYPLAVYWPRTANWYTEDWREMSSWCDATFGPGEWEYFNTEFRFKNQEQVNWFVLRWQE